MGWFTRLCRQTGLVIHEIIKPVRKDRVGKRVAKRNVEEEKLTPTVTLRRTTIEEIEIKQDDTEGP